MISLILMVAGLTATPDVNINHTQYITAAVYPEYRPDAPIPERPHLTRSGGTFDGPSAMETYYNLPMGRCISMMRDLGYGVEEYPFYIREDGAKMLGDYVMIAVNTYEYPKGTIFETSLGMGIVADHCERAESENVIDIATDW